MLPPDKLGSGFALVSPHSSSNQAVHMVGSQRTTPGTTTPGTTTGLGRAGMAVIRGTHDVTTTKKWSSAAGSDLNDSKWWPSHNV